MGSSGEEDVWEVNSPRSGMSRFGGVCEIPSSSASSTITSASGSGMASAATGWSDGLDGLGFGSGFGSGFALWDSCLGSEMGAEVTTWCPPSGVSVCTSACEAKKTLRFLCFFGPGTLPINSISDGPSAAMAAAYAVALAFFSSEIGVFRGILEVHVMIQAIGVESRCVHLN